MTQAIRKYPFFLFLLPVFLLVHIEAEYHRLIDYRLVWVEILYLLLAPPVAYAIAWLLTRSRMKAGVLALIMLIIFYYFPEWKDYLRAKLGDNFWQGYSFWLPVIIIVIAAGAILLRRSKSNFGRVYLFINAALILFIVYDLANIAWVEATGQQEGSKQVSPIADNCDNCEKPDIYFLIFDSYTSSAFLKEKFGFANAVFDSALERKGFRIVRNSRSNYNLTPFSLASIFQQDFLPGVDTTRLYFLKKYMPGVKRVYENSLFPALHRMGYDIYNHSIFDVRSFPTSVPTFDMWDLESIYQQHNLVKRLGTDIGYHFPIWKNLLGGDPFLYANDRNRHDSIALRHIHATIQQQTQQPKFVYGHLFVPHSPYTFDSAGNKFPMLFNLSPEEEMKAYVQQIGYVNGLMTGLVDDILTHSKKPVAIIIQGDHGYRFFDTTHKQWEFPNFNAFYFSNRDYSRINDTTSSVNTFRIVGNTFFRQELPLLEGRTHFLLHSGIIKKYRLAY